MGVRATAATAQHLDSSDLRSTALRTSIEVEPMDHRISFEGMRIKSSQPPMSNLYYHIARKIVL